jgi:hypothetical protein
MANKRTTRTRTKLSTFETDLGSIVRSNLNKFNPLPFSFILDKTLQLEETPIANPIIHSPSKISSSNAFEIFHYNLASIKIINNLFADFMINSSHEPLLSSRNLLEKSSGTSCAFALEFTSQESEFPFNLFYFGGVEELSIRSDSKIINPQVHTENSVRTRTNGAFLGECEQEETFTFGNPQKAFINFPTEIGFVTIWNSERNFNPSFYCRDTQDIIFEREASGCIISNGTEFNKGFILGFLNKPTGLFDTGYSQLRRQSESSQILINKGMQFNIISDFHLPSSINTELHSFLIDSNSINNFLSWFNSNFSCCSGSHNNYKDNNYINLSKLNNEEVFLLPTINGLGIRKTRFT